MIYAIVEPDNKYVKIGYVAGCPDRDRAALERRMSALEIGNPRPLRCVALAPGEMQDEKQLHVRFARFCVRGEWFKNEGPVAEWLTQWKLASVVRTRARKGHIKRCRWPNYCNCARCRDVAARYGGFTPSTRDERRARDIKASAAFMQKADSNGYSMQTFREEMRRREAERDQRELEPSDP